MSYFATVSLSARFSLIVGVMATLLLGSVGWGQLQKERADLLAVEEREALLLGRALQVAFENALRDRQIEDVTETLQALSVIAPNVRILIFDEESIPAAASPGATHSDDTMKMAQRAQKHKGPMLEWDISGQHPRLLLAIPLREESPDLVSAIVLEKPLDALVTDLRTTQWLTWGTVALFVLTVSALTWLLAHRYVRKPLSLMVRNMRIVRLGSLDVEELPSGLSEVGETLTEFVSLVRALNEARKKSQDDLAARQRLEQGLQQADKLITLGQLSAVMAHEIGSPLQVLEGRARSLVQKPNDATETRRIALLIAEQTERITRIVSQMLSFTRRRTLAYSSADVHHAIVTVLSLLELEAKKRFIQFEKNFSTEVRVWANSDELQQLFLNLLRNALDATPNDGRIFIDASDEGACWAVRIQDEGPGLSEQARAHLFEPFFSTKLDSGGTGLGLSIVKSIVDRMGGVIRFEAPSRGSGCLVVVRLLKDRRGK